MLTEATVASLMVTLVMRVVMVRTGRVTGMKMGSVTTMSVTATTSVVTS